MTLSTRTAEDLLAERRANVQEQRQESDPEARMMLQAHIDEIDEELARRRAERGEKPLPVWPSVAAHAERMRNGGAS